MGRLSHLAIAFCLVCFLTACMGASSEEDIVQKMPTEATSTASSALIDLRADNPFMQAAIEEAYEGITHNHGGPFGAVVVKDGEIVGSGHNRVLVDNDPTCHGEIAVIRDACTKLGTYDLAGCEMYTTGEPCPMCLFACMWANVDKVYYGCTIDDNSLIGFRDEAFDSLLGGREQLEGYLVCMDRDACLKLFEAYGVMEHDLY